MFIKIKQIDNNSCYKTFKKEKAKNIINEYSFEVMKYYTFLSSFVKNERQKKYFVEEFQKFSMENYKKTCDFLFGKNNFFLIINTGSFNCIRKNREKLLKIKKEQMLRLFQKNEIARIKKGIEEGKND